MKFTQAEFKERYKTCLPAARLKQLRKSRIPEVKELLGHIEWLEYLQAKQNHRLEKLFKRAEPAIKRWLDWDKNTPLRQWER
jgi:hypothetical protein